MSRRPNTTTSNWLKAKYGQEIRPWERMVYFKNDDELFKVLPATITYKYFKVDDQKGKKVAERVTHRKLEILKPEKYRGIR